MILLIDNYDSFVYNLRRYLVRLGQDVEVIRNDHLDLATISAERYQAIIISPGPCGPDQAGSCLELVRQCCGSIPMLGVCLGHQIIWQALGGQIRRAKTPIHGRASQVRLDSSQLFSNCDSPLWVARYHSLVADGELPPRNVRVVAWSDDDEIMAFEHTDWPIFGVQFHPESILTTCGYQLLQNFLAAAELSSPDLLPQSDLRDESDLMLNEVIEAEEMPIAVFPGSWW